MRGLGDFQHAQMKHRDQRVFLLCQHLRAAIGVFEEIASAPHVEEKTVEVAPPPPSLGVGKTTLYQAMKAGAFKVVKLGN